MGGGGASAHRCLVGGRESLTLHRARAEPVAHTRFEKSAKNYGGIIKVAFVRQHRRYDARDDVFRPCLTFEPTV